MWSLLPVSFCGCDKMPCQGQLRRERISVHCSHVTVHFGDEFMVTQAWDSQAILHPKPKNREKWINACITVLSSLPPCVYNPGLPWKWHYLQPGILSISINLIKIISHPEAHRLPWSRQFFNDCIFTGDSRLYQTDKWN